MRWRFIPNSLPWPCLLLGVQVLLNSSGFGQEQEVVFSGPQPGEPLLPFVVQGVFDNDAGKDLDFVTQADGNPIVLIFVHDVNRQSVSMVRVLSGFTHSRAANGLATGIVWLADDVTAAENQLHRIRHALTPGAVVGISPDGREGPGSYGLNRKVTLTILVGKAEKVTANFALIQPSLQADLPKILKAIVEVAGGEIPRLQDLAGMPDMMRRQEAANQEPLNLRPLLAPVIRKDASDEDVIAAAGRVEQHAATDRAVRREVGRIAGTIVDSGKLSNYGTKKAQEFLKKWASEFRENSSENGSPPVESPSESKQQTRDEKDRGKNSGRQESPQ